MRYLLITDGLNDCPLIEAYPDYDCWDTMPSELLPPREEWELGKTIMFESQEKATEYVKQEINCTKFNVVSW